MKRMAFVLFFALTGSLFAQDAVPEIPFDSNANLLKLPPDLYLGEVSGVAVNSKGHIFIFSRGNITGPAYAATAAQLLEFDRMEISSARSARTCTRGRSRTPCGWIKTTISGPSTKART